MEQHWHRQDVGSLVEYSLELLTSVLGGWCSVALLWEVVCVGVRGVIRCVLPGQCVRIVGERCDVVPICSSLKSKVNVLNVEVEPNCRCS
eukprot:2366742-Rhodomonas_salina.2